jgi:hypothetical protein
LLPPLSASTSRSRAYTSSTSSLDRRKKRSTVWYTISEGDMYGNKSRVSLFSLELSKKRRKNKKGRRDRRELYRWIYRGTVCCCCCYCLCYHRLVGPLRSCLRLDVPP